MDKSVVKIVRVLVSLFFVLINEGMSTSSWKSLEQHLQKINKPFINLEANQKRLFTQHFNNVYKHVTDTMGEIDEFFAHVFQRQQLAGSYADRIKVGQPDEYDALMVLDFPDPILERSKPGFVKINVRDGVAKKWSTVDAQNYKALIDKDGYLLQDKVLDWLRVLIIKVLKRCDNVIRIGQNEYSVKRSSNGPAVTLHLTITQCNEGTTGNFSIDFVGALAFDFHKKWFADHKPQFLISKNWNAIVKPNKAYPNENREWTCSYADMEREYLRDTQKLKQLIRIFKKIRDRNSLGQLKSYYIKVMFLHQRKAHDNDHWKRGLGVLFEEMFEVILKHVEKRELLSFWHKAYNLFAELTPVQMTQMYDTLKSIKAKIDKNLADNNPKFVLSVILSKEELEELEKLEEPHQEL